jgi:hypothetical protein
MAGAVIAAAFRVAVIHVRVQPFAGGIFKLLVSHGAKRHAALLARLFAPQNGVILLAADVGPFKPDERVVLWVVNNHVYACIYMILFFIGGYGLYVAVAFRGSSSNPPAKSPVPALVAT